MRILHIASGDLWAGAENVVYQLCSGLARIDGVNVELVLLNHGRLEDLCVEAGVHTTVFDEQALRFDQIARRLMGHVRRQRPDIVHAHRYKENILAALAWPASGFAPLVTTIHGMGEMTTLKSRLKPQNWGDRLLRRLVFARQVAVSDDIASRLGVGGRSARNKTVRIYNGIEIPPEYAREKRTGSHVMIGSAGRLVPVKDYSLMVRIAADVCRRRDDVRFVLAGDGPLQEQIAGLVREHGLESRFELRGHVKDMDSFYRDLDLYVSTSRHEGAPMTILEAMGHGCPVVAPRVGGLGEIIRDGRDGFLVDGRSPRTFARTIECLADGGKLRLRMGKSARERVRASYSTARMTAHYVRLYEQARDGDR